MQIEQDRIKLVPMTAEKYRSFFQEYENDPDLYLPGQEYVHYEFSEEKAGFILIREDHDFKYYRIHRSYVSVSWRKTDGF